MAQNNFFFQKEIIIMVSGCTSGVQVWLWTVWKMIVLCTAREAGPFPVKQFRFLYKLLLYPPRIITIMSVCFNSYPGCGPLISSLPVRYFIVLSPTVYLMFFRFGHTSSFLFFRFLLTFIHSFYPTLVRRLVFFFFFLKNDPFLIALAREESLSAQTLIVKVSKTRHMMDRFKCL